MLNVAREREVEGDLLLSDLGHGLPLRAGAFDGAISISAVQWLCNAVRPRRAPGLELGGCSAVTASPHVTGAGGSVAHCARRVLSCNSWKPTCASMSCRQQVGASQHTFDAVHISLVLKLLITYVCMCLVRALLVQVSIGGRPEQAGR